MSDWLLYRRWVFANGWSECIGLGATGVLGWWVMRITGEPSSVVAVLRTALLGVAGGMLFEGILVGYAQARVLRAWDADFHSGPWIGPILGTPQMFVLRRYARPAGRWVLANALAWAVGMPVVFLGAVHRLFLIRLLPASGG